MSLSLMDGLKARLQWLQARQSLVSSNIANANSPGFKPLDLQPFKGGGASGLALAATNASHLSQSSNAAMPDSRQAMLFETKPSGNAVSLEDEMTKLADIQIDYQMASQLYTKSLGLLKIAIGKR